MSVESCYRLSEVQWPETPFLLHPNLIMVVRRGSEAHGTYVPPESDHGIDDRDILGLVIPPFEYYVGLKEWKKNETQEINGPWDVVLYDLKKFVKLLTAQNLNLLTALWCEKEDYLYRGPLGHVIVHSRKLFRGREKFHKACIGYAQAQLKKMTSYSLSTGYMGKKRKQLVEKYGYDCKNGAHLIRLLHMGEEFHLTGELKTSRTHDRQQLIDIKLGRWPLEAVQEEAEKCFKAADAAYQKSVLPEEVDVEAVNNLLVREMKGWFFERIFKLRSHPELLDKLVKE